MLQRLVSNPLTLAAGTFLGATLLSTTPATAAILTYDFTVTPDSEPLFGESYAGSFSFDDGAISGFGEEYIALDNFEFSFLGEEFGLDDGLSLAEAAFFDGDFLGLSFVAEEFSFIPGFFDLSESYLAYEIESGVGAADIAYDRRDADATPVPEPVSSTVLLLVGLTGMALRRSRQS